MADHRGIEAPDGVTSFDHYARLVCRVLRVPRSTVTIVETDRQIFPGACGLQEPARSSRQTPLSHSYCRYVVADRGPLMVPDAREDPRLADSPAVHDGAIAYAGWPLHDGAGRTIGALCAVDTEPREWTTDDVKVLEDLAAACSVELQHAGRVVREGEALARAVFGAVDVGMAFFDPAGHLLLGNDRARELARAAGHRLDRPPYAGPCVRQADNTTPVEPDDQLIPRALRGDLEEHAVHWLGPAEDGTAVLGSSHEVQREDGTLWGTLVVSRDVTDLARALEELEQATRAAESANEAKSHFLANISHELRTPLTSMLAALEMLEDATATPEQAGLLAVMARSGGRLRALIESLLQFARIEAGELEVVAAPFDVAAAVADVVATVRDHPQSSGLAIAADVDARLPRFVMVDGDRLRQVLTALMDNGVKFTDSGGVTLSVGVEQLPSGESELVCAVRDTGDGIHPDHHGSVFEPFTQIDPSMTRRHGGSGLGLATCRQLVTLMGGDIAVESSPGLGSTFTVRLPLRLP